jgi:uncharacterized SAM-dependent methyltransferase
MLYFKHAELAAQYHVSIRTVHNWIDEAKQGKLELILHNEGNKIYIANTAKNITALNKIVDARRKYRNKVAVKRIKPKADFYALFNQEQVFDIISSLEIHHEIPRQYNYFDGGAERWERYAERLATEDTPNILTSTIKLLDINRGYIDNLLEDYDRVNVVDVGVGNAYPTKELLTHLLDMGKIGRYIALDISPSMLKIAENNIKHWFDGDVQFEGYECDINHDRFSTLTASEYMERDTKKTLNLILLLGGTLSNMKYPDNGYRAIHDSMGLNDVLLHTTKLDTEASRRYFDFNFEPGNTSLSPNHRLIFDLLNIDKSLYDIEMGYDPSLRQRYIRVRLKFAVIVEFAYGDGKRVVSLNKGDTILLWRGLQHSASDVIGQLDRNDFYPLHVSQTSSQEYILTVSRIKRD